MKKKFDAVKFQRNIREELSKKYSSNSKELLEELKGKYGNLPKKTANARKKFRAVATS